MAITGPVNNNQIISNCTVTSRMHIKLLRYFINHFINSLQFFQFISPLLNSNSKY